MSHFPLPLEVFMSIPYRWLDSFLADICNDHNNRFFQPYESPLILVVHGCDINSCI